MTDSRCDDQIIIDALTAERKKLEKKAARYLKQLESPMDRALAIHKEVADFFEDPTTSVEQRLAFADKKQKELKELEKENQVYQKRDYLKTLNKETTCRLEIDSITSIIARLKFKMSRR